jgi:tetratricopeptide (TPR) repeat protein
LIRLGRTHRDQGDFAKATAELKEALRVVEKTLGSKHLDAAGPLTELGRLSLERQNPTQAVAFLERALTLRESKVGEPASLAEVRFLLARSLWDAGADRRRAVHLAELARGQYSLIGTPAELEESQHWLEQHRP